MKKTLIPFVLAFSCLLLLPLPSAWAHKVHIFAYLDGETVYTESYFSDGRPVAQGTIEVRDGDNQPLLTGTTDPQGFFSFPAITGKELVITIIAAMGHKGSFTLKCLGGCPKMPFFPSPAFFGENNAGNIIYMTALIFPKLLDLRKNCYSRTTS